METMDMVNGASRLVICVLFFSWIGLVFSPKTFGQSLGSQLTDAQPPAAVQTLELNQAITRELAGGQNQVYQLAVQAGQYLEAVIEQRGVDVTITLFAPD